MEPRDVRRISGYCALCVSRCGSTAVVEDGRFVALEPDPSHPTGKALCAKGRAAPELVYHPDRLLHPLRRTRPKGDPDPGWERIPWDEALDETARRLRAIADEHGPESVVFSMASPSTSASDDATMWIQRLRRAFGSPNECVSMELCGWGRYLATAYTFGASVPGRYMPDLQHAGCILFWGYNPSVARLCHAVATTEALQRGARLIVVDPRRAGLANKADVWLRVRPGTDAALALGIAHVMIRRGWYDRDFIRTWTNGPLLVREDDGRFLSAADLRTGDAVGGSGRGYVAWDEATAAPMVHDPTTAAFRGARDETGASGPSSLAGGGSSRGGGPSPDDDVPAAPALTGTYEIETPRGRIACRPAFDVVAAACSTYTPDRVEALCGIAADQVVEAARMLWEARPMAYYAWSGVEMQSNATQIARAIAQLHVLTGSLDVQGGNVLFTAPPTEDVSGADLLAAERRGRTLGLEERPLGPARWEWVTTDDMYRGMLQDRPYPVRGLVGFGANLLLAHADGARGREALSRLDFYVHADLFMNPTAEQADIVLPVASAFEREGLRVGFEVSQEAQRHVQLRPPVVAPRGQARSDVDIIFDLACRLGLGDHFWDGDVDAGLRHRLAPSGVSLETLRENPAGLRIPLEARYRKFAERIDGVPRGFDTPSRTIELYSEALLEHGYPPVPSYEAPRMGRESRPDLAERFPLVLTCAKHALFCETQHRGLPSLRRRALHPEVELHPDAAAARGVAAGDWVRIETPKGDVRARARLNDTLEPDVVCGQHGWWQPCDELGAPGYEPFGPDGANFNLLIGDDAVDPVSGSVPHRAYLCEVRRLEGEG